MIAIVGLGEMGELLAAAFLKQGHPIYPVLRGDSIAHLIESGLDPALIVLAVGEADLRVVIEDVPLDVRHRLLLLQNELLPPDWLRHGIHDPTVLVVWLDKKAGRPPVSVLPNRVAGPHAAWVSDALNALNVPTFVINTGELTRALVAKNLYILTVNIAGLYVGGTITVGALLEQYAEVTYGIAQEILTIQSAILGTTLNLEIYMSDFLEGCRGDLKHLCRGRSAPIRLSRALSHASHYGIEVPYLWEVKKTFESPSQ